MSFDRVRTAFEELANAHQELVGYMEKQQFDQVQKVADERVMPRAEVVTTEAKQLVQARHGPYANGQRRSQIEGYHRSVDGRDLHAGLPGGRRRYCGDRPAHHQRAA
ncbi:MAG: hypothetical protein WDO73_17155 [Ignavibacteriota bacterium]